MAEGKLKESLATHKGALALRRQLAGGQDSANEADSHAQIALVQLMVSTANL